MTTAPVLSYPMKEGMFILDTDASNTSMGGVLSQMQKDGSGQWVEKPIAYASRKFDERERKYCARRRELLAIILAPSSLASGAATSTSSPLVTTISSRSQQHLR